ncbi:trypsin-like [Dendropsophus ebraccatus]|uniref:trypsin-like n=1 Tax=Dendropsophus ebraccatus TaxID=150705 RepID=UPI003831F1BB
MKYRQSSEMFLLLVAAVLGPTVKAYSVERILGGEECVPHSQPWQVALYYFDKFICGGILINEYWVLTAAHCNVSNIQVRLGEHNLTEEEGTEQFTYAVKICPHENYCMRTYDNDIMLLKLASPAIINDYVTTISLPSGPLEDFTTCLISGWGTTTSPEEMYPGVLMCLNVTSFPDAQCQQFYQGENITENMFCAGVLEAGKDSCQGDSGGPLVYGSQVHGIISWGGIICGQENKPGVYTKVINYITWINNVIENEDPGVCRDS